MLLRLAGVLAMTGHSESSWYRAMADGSAPRPLKRGAVSLWPESEIAAYIQQQKQTLPRMGQSMGARRQPNKKAA
jgi:predicted DNA-binding transcriptional regulator AlpA